MLEEDLGDRPYVLADSASLVDFHLVSFLGWMAMCSGPAQG